MLSLVSLSHDLPSGDDAPPEHEDGPPPPEDEDAPPPSPMAPTEGDITTINSETFCALRAEPKAVRTTAKVVFRECGDIHPRRGLSFPDAEVVCLELCDKNFVHYWLAPHVFPKVKTIYLNSHPCQMNSPFTSFPDSVAIHLSTWFGRYKERWFDRDNNIVVSDLNTFPSWRTTGQPSVPFWQRVGPAQPVQDG